VTRAEAERDALKEALDSYACPDKRAEQLMAERDALRAALDDAVKMILRHDIDRGVGGTGFENLVSQNGH
jgi:hypothetical protein